MPRLPMTRNDQPRKKPKKVNLCRLWASVVAELSLKQSIFGSTLARLLLVGVSSGSASDMSSLHTPDIVSRNGPP